MLWKTSTEGHCILFIHLAGITAATLTRTDEGGNLKLDRVGAIVDHFVPRKRLGPLRASHHGALRHRQNDDEVRSTDFSRPFGSEYRL